MSKLTERLNELASTEEKTVVVDRDDIEKELRRAAEERTVVDSTAADGAPAFDSRLDPELEAILRETEGYIIEPDDAAGTAAEPEYQSKPAPERTPPNTL